MASCIEPLITGFPEASGGTAEFYQAGTSTPSTLVFSDQAGTVAASAPHTLNGSGRIERYVEERVRIVVKTSGGATVAEWTHGQDAKTINVENDLFTGSLNGGGTGPGGHTTLDTGLTRFFGSLDADDGQVDPGTGAVDLSAALASSAGLFLNVKAGYGAAGNGVADDTAEIQAAVNAGINANGGIVFFPPGTYPVSAAVTTASDSGLAFQGVNPARTGTRLTKVVVTANGLTGGLVVGTSHLTVRDLTFAATAGTTTSPLAALAASTYNVRFENCTFLGGSAPIVAGLAGAAGVPAAVFHNCYFVLTNAAGSFVSGGPSGTNGIGGIFDNCVFDFGGLVPSGAVFDNNRHIFKGCQFLMNSATGGVTVFPNAAGSYLLDNCTIISSNTSGTNTFFQNGTCTITGGEVVVAAGSLQLASSSATLREAGCAIPNAVLLAAGLQQLGSFSAAWQGRYITSDPGGPSYVASAEYANHDVALGLNGTFTVTMPAGPMYPTARLRFIVEQTAAASTMTIAFTGAFTTNADVVLSSQNVMGHWDFRWCRDHVTTPSWMICQEHIEIGGTT